MFFNHGGTEKAIQIIEGKGGIGGKGDKNKINYLSPFLQHPPFS
jgi:hypothetical protein